MHSFFNSLQSMNTLKQNKITMRKQTRQREACGTAYLDSTDVNQQSSREDEDQDHSTSFPSVRSSSTATATAIAIATASESDSECKSESACSKVQTTVTSLSNHSQSRKRLCVNKLNSHAFPLYDDALKMLIQHLTFCELPVCAQLSHQWYRVIQRTKPTESVKRRTVYQHLQVSSAVASHVLSLNYAFSQSSQCLWSFEELCPNLRSLTLGFYPNINSGFNTLQLNFDRLKVLPRQIAQFTCSIPAMCLSSLLLGISQLHRLEDLSIRLSASQSNSDGAFAIQPSDIECFLRADFAQLHVLHQLRALKLDFASSNCTTSLDQVIPSSFISLIRMLPALEICDVSEIICSAPILIVVELIRRIAQQPNELKLKPLKVGKSITEPLVEALGLIPSITVFSPFRNSFDIPVDKFHLLANLPNLARLMLDSYPETITHPISSANAVIATKHCPNLSKLNLNLVDLCFKDLNNILSQLSRLKELRLYRCPCIRSLSFLRDHGLPGRLKLFHCYYSGPMPTSEDEHVYCSQQLESLSLCGCFDTNFSDETQQKLVHFVQSLHSKSSESEHIVSQLI